MSQLEEKIMERCGPIAQQAGLELVEAKLTSHGGKKVLTLYIWSEDHPISLDDCAAVHEAVDPVLDELDPTGGAPYTLNVSSLGLDRPIVTDGDFRRSLGKEVTAKFFAPIDGQKEWSGTLTAFTEDRFSLEEGGTVREFERKKACKVQLKLDF